MEPQPRALESIMRRQSQVVTRQQVLHLGGDGDWIRSRVRSGHWRRQYYGVYVTTTGPMTWRTRATAAVLYAGAGAALSHSAAAYRLGLSTRAPSTIELSIPHARVVSPAPGLRLHRRRMMPAAHGRPRTVTTAETFVDLADRARSIDDVVGLATRAARVTHSRALRVAVASRTRLRHRRLLEDVLGDVDVGVESPLERRYHYDVERAHGLPRATLQRREALPGLWLRSDCTYDPWRVRVELDGQLGHPGGASAADIWRDNAVRVHTGDITLRYRWVHIAATPCETASQVARALHARGWWGTVRSCGPRCPAGHSG
ncbi:hypothetical protein [Bogoriella caseilytica]|nr:hypothetical protein [Bogoriella caseilytica]